MNKNTARLTFSSILTAFVCVSTMIIQIKLSSDGYLNLGDCFVLISGWLLGPLWGFLSAGIGSALADIITGYAVYALPTFIIKGAMATLSALIMRAFAKRKFTGYITGALAAELLMVFGYFGVSCILLKSFTASVAGLPGNFMQAILGLVSSVVLIRILEKAGLVKKIQKKIM